MIEGWIKSTVLNFGVTNDRIAESLTFFIYDSIKIILLMFLMIFVVGIIRTYIPQNKIKKILSGKKVGIGNLFAAIFGAITPFCSCSSIPIFMGLLEAGVPAGVSFSFLITSPIVNEYLFVIMLGLFGWKIAVAYVITGIILGIVGGLVLGRLRVEKYFKIKPNKDIKYKEQKIEFKKRIRFGLNEAKQITRKTWLAILIGVAIGAIIHNAIPDKVIYDAVSKLGFFGVPVAVLLGVPLYANCAAIVPVAYVLFQKGIPLGTALAFMMAVAALSLPEFVILSKVVKKKLLFMFFGIVALFIVLIGYLFNIFGRFLV